jgi:hypothetical protein
MVSNRMSSLMGEAGEVKTVQTRMCCVLLDGDTEPLTFHLDEVTRLP